MSTTGDGSVPVYLVRHAQAEQRERWPGADTQRPLTERGLRQADAIAGLFDTSPRPAPSQDLGASRPRPTVLISSAAERCVATLRPLATACNLPIVTADYLLEGADPAGLLLELRQLAARGGTPVLCGHGDVIWGLVDLLVAAGVGFDGDVEIKKGSVLVLEAEPEKVVSARYIPPPKV